jgi:hypothetical protein
MVPELAAGAAAELTDLRDAVVAAAASLPQRWVAIGAGPADAVVSPQRAGTFGGYGVGLPVTLSPGVGDAPGELPLCALITGWIRGQAKPAARAEVRVYGAGHDVDAALVRGRRLRAEIDEAAHPVGVLVVADGAHTLTPPAPGGYDSDSVPLARLPDIVVGRVAYQVLAGLTEPAPRSATQLYRGAPYGVGYFVGVWQP